MPTGYTCYIEEGKIDNGFDFLKLCARAFGALTHMREDSLDVGLPAEIKPDTKYYEEQLKKRQQELLKIEKLTDEEIVKIIESEHAKNILDYKNSLGKNLKLKTLYSKIRNEVSLWTPPTDEHRGVKKFALEQIDMCLPDSMIEFYEKGLKDLEAQPERSPAEYRNAQRRFYQEDIDHYRKEISKETERAFVRNKWLIELVNSLS